MRSIALFAGGIVMYIYGAEKGLEDAVIGGRMLFGAGVLAMVVSFICEFERNT